MELADTVVGILSKLPNLLRDSQSDSLSEFNAIANSEYITLVESSLANAPYIPNLLSELEILMACQLLTTVSILVAPPSVDIIGTMDKVSTKRDPLHNAVRGAARLGKWASESTKLVGLPSYEGQLQLVQEAAGNSTRRGNYFKDAKVLDKSHTENIDSSDKSTTVNALDLHGATTVEGNGNTVDNSRTNTTSTVTNNNSRNGKQSGGIGKDSMKHIYQDGSLTSGKTFSVSVERDGNSAEWMMGVRLSVMYPSTEEMRNAITIMDRTNDWSSRKLKVKSGLLSTWSDLIFCNDLIEQHRKARYKDKTGYYTEMMRRRGGNWLSGLFSLNPSLNNASAIWVVDQNTIDSCAAELGGDLDDVNIRNQLFKDSLTTLIAVCDDRYRLVTIYTRGISMPTTVSYDDLKGSSKSGGGSSNVDEIIRAYTSGQNPTLF